MRYLRTCGACRTIRFGRLMGMLNARRRRMSVRSGETQAAKDRTGRPSRDVAGKKIQKILRVSAAKCDYSLRCPRGAVQG